MLSKYRVNYHKTIQPIINEMALCLYRSRKHSSIYHISIVQRIALCRDVGVITGIFVCVCVSACFVCFLLLPEKEETRPVRFLTLSREHGDD